MSEAKKSIIVVADTHFGLKKETQVCDPKAFSDFLKWIKHLEGDGEKQTIARGIWGFGQEKKLAFESPEKIVFLATSWSFGTLQ